MEAPTPTLLKIVEIKFEEQKYICKIQNIDDELIGVSVFLLNSLLYKGNIHLESIREQIITFYNYNIKEIYEEIYQLNFDDFSLTKEFNKYKLKIKFIILKKEINLLIDLIENKDIKIPNNDIIDYYENIIKEKNNTISELKEIIKFKDEKIESLEEQLKNINKKVEKTIEKKNNTPNYDLYNDFNIKLKNPIHKLNIHTSKIVCLSVLNDGRLVSGSNDYSIIIYNKITYRPDIIIKEHSGGVNCITQLNSGILVSCSDDKTIKLFKIKEKEYEILQTLDYHSDKVYKIVELKNKYLTSCSEDASIIFYFKDNFEYIKDYKISTNGASYSIIQTKENEICYSEYKKNNSN